MSDLVGTQIVGFLTHKLVYCLLKTHFGFHIKHLNDYGQITNTSQGGYPFPHRHNENLPMQ